MKKILFNDKFLLTKAVLEGRKTQTRRVIKVQPPYKNFDMAFPVFVEEDWHTNPLYGAFCWVNKDNPEEHTDWIRPAFKESEVVAVAQSYKDAGIEDVTDKDGFLYHTFTIYAYDNKMFVRADMMPHQIRITNVRVERLQNITDECCLREGLEWDAKAQKYYAGYMKETEKKYWFGSTPREAFAHLINKVSRKDVWSDNPYVFVYDFEVIK